MKGYRVGTKSPSMAMVRSMKTPKRKDTGICKACSALKFRRRITS